MNRVHAGAVITPADADRRTRRATRKSARALVRQHRDAEQAQRRGPSDDEPGSDPAPTDEPSSAAAGRSWLALRLQAHRATTAALAVVYPFLADGGLGARGIYIGRDLLSGGSFCFDPWQLYEARAVTNPNVLLAGVIGQGKSSLAKAIAWRSVVFGRRTYVPGDIKGEWTPVVEAAGGSVIRLGPGRSTRLNPLDEGARPGNISDAQWRTLVQTRRRQLLRAITETVLDGPLAPTEHTALTTALSIAEQSTATPTLPDVVQHLLAPSPLAADMSADDVAALRDDGRRAGHALRRLIHGDLAGLFDGPSTTVFDPSRPMISLDLSAFGENSEALPVIMTCASSWMEGALQDSRHGRRWIIYDEAWRLMAVTALLRRMQAQWKLSRAFGIANMAVIHRLSDLDAIGADGSEARALAAGLLADCSTRISYRQESDQVANSANLLGLTSTQRDLLTDLGVGEGLWRIGQRAYVVAHHLSGIETALFDTDARMKAHPQ
ncbi:ATP-binding protein [Phytoactinopolyspora alkaliphila]|uniref:ATP-binding protein n=1 Tax=Phytoactinopolyspora alkaliphila TaxID=1783498 RepID=A0A6N9YQP0_9ACTN|nr:ATP-binding protein [Phytoactinopolyspora alkaliphila]NED97139.1 ATP-binding protein [Phytoactinopolyspora alkaliphila]